MCRVIAVSNQKGGVGKTDNDLSKTVYGTGCSEV